MHLEEDGAAVVHAASFGVVVVHAAVVHVASLEVVVVHAAAEA